jgi:hypothetical protein
MQTVISVITVSCYGTTPLQGIVCRKREDNHVGRVWAWLLQSDTELEGACGKEQDKYGFFGEAGGFGRYSLVWMVRGKLFIFTMLIIVSCLR